MWTAPGRPTGTVSQHVPPRHITSRVLLRCFRNHKSSQITWVVDLSTFKVDSYGKCGSTLQIHTFFSPLFHQMISLYNIMRWPPKMKIQLKNQFSNFGSCPDMWYWDLALVCNGWPQLGMRSMLCSTNLLRLCWVPISWARHGDVHMTPGKRLEWFTSWDVQHVPYHFNLIT